MKIITISGKAKHGKDTVGKLLKEQLEEQGNKVLITHFADLLKYMCKMFFDWDGEKNEEGRTKLQYVGTDVIREQCPDYWVDFLMSVFNLFPNEWDYVIIPDSRFPNENDKLKGEFDVVTIRVERPNFNNELTEEQQNHESETSLDNYIFDYKIINEGNENIHKAVSDFISWLKTSEV